MQLVENTFLRQFFEMKRVRQTSAAVAHTEKIKAERFGNQCTMVSNALERLDAAVSQCVEVFG